MQIAFVRTFPKVCFCTQVVRYIVAASITVHSIYNFFFVGELLTVEFLRFISANTLIEISIRSSGIVHLGLVLRDSLKKFTEDRRTNNPYV